MEKNTADPESVAINEAVAARFWPKVDRRGPTDCWTWTATRTHQGYGTLTINGRNHRAHRLALMLSGVDVPASLVVDHLCRNKACVNPAHLEVVTARENTLRGWGPTAVNALKTHCPLGHELAGDNLFVSNNERRCRICKNKTHMAWKRRTAAKRAALQAKETK